MEGTSRVKLYEINAPDRHRGLEKREELLLAPYAMFAKNSEGRSLCRATARLS